MIQKRPYVESAWVLPAAVMSVGPARQLAIRLELRSKREELFLHGEDVVLG